MSDLPKVSKGIASGLTHLESVRRIVAGTVLALGLASSTGTAAAAPAQNDAVVTPVIVKAQDRGAILLSPPASSNAADTVAQHWSHQSHYSHSSHQSHYSHYSSR